MSLDRVHTEVQKISHFLVRFSLRHELQNFSLARSQQIVCVLRTGALQLAYVIVQKNLAYSRAKERLAPRDGTDGRDQVRLSGILQKVTLRASLQGAQNIAFVRMHAQHNHRNLRVALRDL